MSRPQGGYKLKDGTKVPGTTTVISRFKDGAALVQWAWKQGIKGADINDVRDRAADAGTCCHGMIECHLRGQLHERGRWDKEILAKADHAFLAYLEWASQNNLKMEQSELSLVSEVHRYGGTLDIATISGEKRTILDIKTSGGCYADYLVQLGAYSLLWQEHYPTKPIDGLQILRITKPQEASDPISFHHHYWSGEVLPIAQRQFLLLLEAYQIDKRLRGLL